MIIHHDISLGKYFHLVSYLMPDLWITILPTAFAVAIVIVIGRLTTTNEIRSALKGIKARQF